MQNTIYKTPAEYGLYTLDYSARVDIDNILSSAWAGSDPALIVNGSPAIEGLITSAFIGGGTGPVSDNLVTNTIVTQGGRTLQEALRVIVRPYNFLPEVIIKEMGQEFIDYSIDWTPRLIDPVGETIVNSAWAYTGHDNALVISTPTSTPPSRVIAPLPATLVWLSGGTLDQGYIVTNTVTTSLNRVLQTSCRFLIKNTKNVKIIRQPTL